MSRPAALVAGVVLAAFVACGGSQRMTPASGPPDDRRTDVEPSKKIRKKNTAPPPAYGHKVARSCEGGIPECERARVGHPAKFAR